MSLVHIFNTTGKPSTRKGAWALICGVWTYDVKIIEFQSLYKLISKESNNISWQHSNFGQLTTNGIFFL